MQEGNWELRTRNKEPSRVEEKGERLEQAGKPPYGAVESSSSRVVGDLGPSSMIRTPWPRCGCLRPNADISTV